MKAKIDELMPLSRALVVLARVHTREGDDLVGFVIMEGATARIPFTRQEYIEAWRSVRHAIGEKTEAAE